MSKDISPIELWVGSKPSISENAVGRAEYWKQEHLEGNKIIERLRERVAELERQQDVAVKSVLALQDQVDVWKALWRSENSEHGETIAAAKHEIAQLKKAAPVAKLFLGTRGIEVMADYGVMNFGQEFDVFTNPSPDAPCTECESLKARLFEMQNAAIQLSNALAVPEGWVNDASAVLARFISHGTPKADDYEWGKIANEAARLLSRAPKGTP